MSAGSLYQAHPWWQSHLQDPSVRINNDTNSTDTFKRESVGTVGNNIDMAICCVSFVGALAIILPYIFNKKSRKLRHVLILGLATSDLVTSIAIIITTACLIAKINLVREDGACTFLGYVLVTSIFSQHLWNLSIAIVTYMILVHPLSSFTLTVERRVHWLWPAFWVISFVIDAIPFGFGGFGFRGGYCSLTTGFYFSGIFQFVPRAIVFLVILCLYTHLFFFLRRTNLFKKAHTSNSLSQGQSRHRSQIAAQSKPGDTLRRMSQHDQALMTSMGFNDTLGASADGASPTVKTHSPSGASSAAAHSRKTSSGSRVMPPVLNKNDPNAATRRRSSSLGEKDVSVEMANVESGATRGKGSAADGVDPGLSGLLSSYSMKQTDASPQPATYGLLDPNYSMAPRRTLPSDLDIEKANASRTYDSSSLNAPSPSDSSYAGTGGAATMSTRGSAAPLNASFAPSARRPFTAEAASSVDVDATATPRLGGAAAQRRASAGDSRYHSAHSDTSDSETGDVEAPLHMRPRKDTGDFEMISAPIEHLRHKALPASGARAYPRLADILAMGEDDMARARQGGGGGFVGERRSSAVQILPGEVMVEMPSKEAFEQQLGDDWNWGMNVTAGESKHPHHHSRHRTAGNTDGITTGTSSTSSADENGVDAIGSTLNRQASLLLLLYPAAYCLLFSISIARLSVDLADPGASVRRSHDALHSLSRWLIFAQGAIDALIFQFVERQFRQRMKRRRRRAMGERVEDSLGRKVGKRIVRSFQSRSRGGRGEEEKGQIMTIGGGRA
ncbi:G_PROTEIN_RECEP_F1_2 domain-containing protein [Pseudozyma hubeiensis]|nr:G_PROTEIN_RECEP_F1_2 domain-containing protein [Pseudozyma hubeiensis]